MRLYAVAKVGPGDRFLGYAPKQFFSRRCAERYAQRLNLDANGGIRYVVEQT